MGYQQPAAQAARGGYLADRIMTSKKSKAVGVRDEGYLEAVLAALKAHRAEAPDIARLRKIQEFARILADDIHAQSGGPGATLAAHFSRIPPPLADRLDYFLRGMSSVLTLMPDPIPSRHPWARDLAALSGDSFNTGRDAWLVIARRENERRRQEG